MSEPSPSRAPVATGGCQCGGVRYALLAEPTSPSVCHCRMCQKATGSPFLASAVVQARDLAWTRGAPARFRSSAAAERAFCPACGTPLAFIPVGGTTIEITIASLDQPQRVTPVRQIGTEALLAWVWDLRVLPAKTTAENAGAAFTGGLRSLQHPDHDTPEGWSPDPGEGGKP